MELKFEEIPNLNLEQYNDNNVQQNYWETIPTNPDSKQKKPKVSYDDILSSLNMVIQNGVLKFSNPNPSSNSNSNLKPSSNSNLKPSFNSNSNSNSNLKPIPKKQVTINQAQNVTHNYITNKYFKNYKEETQEEEEEKKSLTKEEYRQLYIKQQQEIKRISEIKSKKLFFSTQNINISPSQNPANLNKLFPLFKK